MNIAIDNVIKRFVKQPRTLFLVDSVGAALTTLSLFVISKYFNDYFGMPVYVLKNLSFIALAFCAYSTTCFFVLRNNWIHFIQLISIANLLYSVSTALLLYLYFRELTTLGLIYFIGEIAIIVTLVYMELSAANAFGKMKKQPCSSSLVVSVELLVVS